MKTMKWVILTGAQEFNENTASSSIIQQREEKPVKLIDVKCGIKTVELLADAEHIAVGDDEGKIRHWGAKDGKEVGTPMDTGGVVWSTVVSQDGKWVVSMVPNEVTVWNAENDEELVFEVPNGLSMVAVDMSPDAMKVATGFRLDDCSTCVCEWSVSTGELLLGPFEHSGSRVAVRFSPNGRFIATAASSIRIYDSLRRKSHLDFQINSPGVSGNRSLTWASDSMRLFVLSHDANIHCLDVSTGTALFTWAIHDTYDFGLCISLARNDTFIAASAKSSVSFWDATTHKQIGSVIHHPARILSMSISADYVLVIGGGTKITLWNLRDILPPQYSDDVSARPLNT